MCGLTREADVDAAVEAGADAVGFVLYAASPRHVSAARAAQLARRLPPLVTPVLLFVNPDATEVIAACAEVAGAVVQFHGDESPELCARAAAGHPWWRAARLPTAGSTDSFDLLQFTQLHSQAHAILLDAQSAGFGGSGKVFDWLRLPTSVNAHLVLSGGLDAANVGDGIAHLRGLGRSLTVDVSSGIEARDASGQLLRGIKDAARMRAFVDAVRTADTSFRSRQKTP